MCPLLHLSTIEKPLLTLAWTSTSETAVDLAAEGEGDSDHTAPVQQAEHLLQKTQTKKLLELPLR